MKRSSLRTGLTALAFAVALAQFTPALHAKSQKSQDDPGAQQGGAQQPDQQQAQTFVGQVVKAKNGQYALLVDKDAGKGYYLDDQQKAEQYNGQNVKVTGTLDVANSTIRVADIQPAG
jgi:Protein of unknown function (DUF5818)